MGKNHRGLEDERNNNNPTDLLWPVDSYDCYRFYKHEEEGNRNRRCFKDG